MTKTRHVLIAGAGIGGLIGALALLQRGFDVGVYEQASELQELGAGLQISANGSRVLYALGLGDAIRRIACEPTGKEIRLWNTGQAWKLFDLGAISEQRYGAPYLMIHRGDLHALLRVESWTERGTKSECAADFHGWHEDVQEIISHIETPFKWTLLGREPLLRWSTGRVSLLGDACHPTLPFLAQGANMAIEDGYVLARCLEAYEEDAEMALRAYEKARLDRTSRIVRGSAENTKRFHNKTLSTSSAAEQYIAAEWQEDRVKERYDWLFDYDATTVGI